MPPKRKGEAFRGGRGRLPHQAVFLRRWALIIRVKTALLRRGPVSRSGVVRVGDPRDRPLPHPARATGRQKTIELTPKEYGLLSEYLATNPGRVFSRTMIIEHVWDQSFEGLTNIVDVYVRHLRSKVDDPFPTKLIKTVRGVGYGLCRYRQPSREHEVTKLPSRDLVCRRAHAGVFVLLGALTIITCCANTSNPTFSTHRRGVPARSPIH